MTADLAPSEGNKVCSFTKPLLGGRVAQKLFRMPRALVGLWFIFACLLACIGCAPDIKPRAVKLEPQTLASSEAFPLSLSAPWPRQTWWEDYGDAQLNRLVGLAVAQSPTLRMAQARVRQAAGAARVSGGGLFPRAEVSAQALYTSYGEQAYKPDALAGNGDWDSNLLASAQYSLDLWGKNRAAYVEGLDNLAAAAAESQAARLVLETAVVRAYIFLSRQYALLDVAQRTLAQREGVLDITRKLLYAGMGTELAVSQAETPIPAARSRIAEIQASIAAIKYQLAALSGQGPGMAEDILPPMLSFTAAPSLPMDLPAELAGHRPDVVAQLWRVEAAGQGIERAKAEFYPNINLLAAAGYVSIGLEHFLTASAQTSYVGPAVSLPLFEGGRLAGNLEARTGEYDEAVESYNQTILNAFSAIASQASRLKSLETQAAETAETMRLARRAYDIASRGYRVGLTDYLNVLAAERDLLSAEERGVSIAAERMDAYASLMQELGGGYDARSNNEGAGGFPKPLAAPVPPAGLPPVAGGRP